MNFLKMLSLVAETTKQVFLPVYLYLALGAPVLVVWCFVPMYDCLDFIVSRCYTFGNLGVILHVTLELEHVTLFLSLFLEGIRAVVLRMSQKFRILVAVRLGPVG